MRRLLDVNVVLALMDPAHLSHEAAHRWFGTIRDWATCPLVQNGAIRVASQPAYPNSPGGPGVVAELLAGFVSAPSHEFWPDDVSLLDERLVDRGLVSKPAQVTDVYLLALAVRHGGRLATFDGRIPAGAVKGGAAALELIPGEAARDK